MKQNIVILDGYTLNPGDLSWVGFEELGLSVSCYDRTSQEEIVSRIGDCSYVLTNKTPITEEILKACPSIKYIGVLATGFNVVDVEAARKLGVVVTNIPTYGTTAVAQYVFALLLELAHHVGHHSQAVKANRWNECPDFCFWDFPLIELHGKTFGIIGMGRIGYATAKIANAFGMNVIAYDSYENKNLEKDVFQYTDLDTLLSTSDVISLHCPLMESTKGILNQESLAKMKKSAMIINTSRGPLIDEQALVDALDDGKIAGAAVDVLSTEPPRDENLLIKNPKCIVTPHIAWAPKESRSRLMDIAVQNLDSFLKGHPINRV